jgi:hypothetical protein
MGHIRIFFVFITAFISLILIERADDALRVNRYLKVYFYIALSIVFLGPMLKEIAGFLK